MVARLLRSIWLLLLGVSACLAQAQNGSVVLSAFPGRCVADGRSTILITAEVRDQSGRTVPEGTQVLFETSLGEFREAIVPTVNGLARGTLVAGGISGVARITATVQTFRSVSQTEVEFVSDARVLSSANEYIEVVAPKHLLYSPESRTIEASGPGKGVHLRYRDVEIEADDMQVRVSTYQVKAKKARLKFAKQVREFDELSFNLSQRSGFGTTSYVAKTYAVWPYHDRFRMNVVERQRFGVVDVRASGITPVPDFRQPMAFQFEDLSSSLSLVAAKKATAFPGREVQFHRADVLVAGQKILKLPLFQVSTLTNSPLVTEQFFNVTQNQLAINYPYYLTLRPGETSLLRLRSGTRYFRGAGATSGTFLDYELKWNRGDEWDGGLTVTGLTRGDWGVSLRHLLKFDPSTSLSAQIDFPSHSTLFGAASLQKHFDGFSMALSANLGQSVRGGRFRSQQYFLAAEKHPIKVGDLPLRLYTGLTASKTSFSGSASSQENSQVALRSRLQMLPQRLSKIAATSASLSLSKPFGRRLATNFAVLGSLAVNITPSPNTVLGLNYDYEDDGFNSLFIGRHRLRSQFSYAHGRMYFNADIARSLDIDRSYFSGVFQYRFNDTWRFYTNFSYDRYRGDIFQDYSLILGYRLGFREIGLSFSARTKRLGIEILGTSF